jgi:uncharacterized protein involved in type VI secretion and phage assembly
MSADFANWVRREIDAAFAGRGARIGIVDTYDPNRYAARVMLMPEGKLTNWLPIRSAAVGAGWGFLTPPLPGTQVKVIFQEDDVDSGVIIGGVFDLDHAAPTGCPAGEFWLVHQSGSLLKFHNDGSVEVISHQNLTATVGGDLSATVTGKTTVTSTGDVALTSSGKVAVTASSEITMSAPAIALN